MLATPSEAAAVLGISRQALLRQRTRLERSGQARVEAGRLVVEIAGLMAWWSNHCRTGATTLKLCRLRRLLGQEPEELLLALGGVPGLEAAVAVLQHHRPGCSIDFELEEVQLATGERVELFPLLRQLVGEIDAEIAAETA